jgi:nucleoside-diphosphate-sugar epimerase
MSWAAVRHDVSMRLLVLGGTWFLGRTLVEQALGRGWQVSTFSRGRDGYDVVGAEVIRGDRRLNVDMDRLTGAGPWDAVVDTSGMEPAMVAIAASALRNVVSRYVYISTVSVYQGWPTEPLTDDSSLLDSYADLAALPERIQYGVLKSGCEAAARAHIDGERLLILRPGVVLGPYEYVGRLPWLLRRMQRGGAVLAAGDPGRPIQPIDVRDLAAFALDAIANDVVGAMNVAAPHGHSTYGELLRACRDATGGSANLVWVADDWLAAQEVTRWSEIPLWRTAAGAWAVSSSRAEAAGLACRPLTDTVTDTWAWLQTEEPVAHERANEIGIARDKETRLLAAWRGASGRGAGR